MVIIGDDDDTLPPAREERGSARHRVQFVTGFTCHRPLAAPIHASLDGASTVSIGRGSRQGPASQEGMPGELSLTVPDEYMSRSHLRLYRHGHTWVAEDVGSLNGLTINRRRCQRATLASGDLLEVGNTFLIYGDAEVGDTRSATTDWMEASLGVETMLPQLREHLAVLGRIGPSPQPVIVQGETGTGKELVARAVHVLSGRTGPFIAVNCAALTETLIGAELFGYRRGAFSGATEDRPGLIRSADGGTLFLDEIGDLPPSAQGSLLRALQEQEVLPVGAVRPVKIDVRVVSATHRNLEAMVAQGQFRSDLLGRLTGYCLDLPPLRQRLGDFPLILRSLLLRRGAVAEQCQLTPAVARALLSHGWPRNVRELDQCIASALALAQDGSIDVQHLPAVVARAARMPLTPYPAEEGAALARELAQSLQRERGNVARVARAMRRARVQVYRWMRRYGLNPQDFR